MPPKITEPILATPCAVSSHWTVARAGHTVGNDSRQQRLDGAENGDGNGRPEVRL